MPRSRLEPPATSSESAARGRDARRTSPRSAHGDWRPDRDALDPVATGVQAASPLAFLCGAPAVMAAYERYCDSAFECWTTRHLENFVNVVAGGVPAAE